MQNLKQFIEPKYKEFCKRLINTRYQILGIRATHLQKRAKQLHQQAKFDEFWDEFIACKDKTYEHLQVIAYAINYEKNFDKAKKLSLKYLEYVDNWANCDSLAPKSFANNDISGLASELIKQNHIYKIRFGIICFMKFIVPKDGLKSVLGIKSDEYYVNMARAWYFQSMFVKDFDVTLGALQKHTLDAPTLQKTLQKCRDSHALSKEQKSLINALKHSGK